MLLNRRTEEEEDKMIEKGNNKMKKIIRMERRMMKKDNRRMEEIIRMEEY